MRVFNRVMTILLFLGLMVALPVITTLPDATFSLLQGFIGAEPLNLTLFHRVILILVGVISFVICALVLYLELRRPARTRVRLRKASGGQVELAIESVEQRLEYRVDELPDVIRVVPKVRAHRNSVDIELNVETSPDIDVPAKTDEICQVARDVVEERMGLKLNRIRVNLKHGPYPDLVPRLPEE